jgi:hypothetical protein
MAVNDIFRVDVFQQCGSLPTMNVLHMRETTARGALEKGTENVLEIVAQLYGDLSAELGVDWRVVSLRAAQISPIIPGPPATTVLGTPEAIEGQITGDIIPSNAPMVISLYSNVVGRKGRGRIYLPGIPETSQADGQLSQAAFTAFQAVANAHFDEAKGPIGAGTGVYRYVVFNPPGPGSANMEVVSSVVRPNMANMRSRRAFVGFSA